MAKARQASNVVSTRMLKVLPRPKSYHSLSLFATPHVVVTGYSVNSMDVIPHIIPSIMYVFMNIIEFQIQVFDEKSHKSKPHRPDGKGPASRAMQPPGSTQAPSVIPASGERRRQQTSSSEPAGLKSDSRRILSSSAPKNTVTPSNASSRDAKLSTAEGSGEVDSVPRTHQLEAKLLEPDDADSPSVGNPESPVSPLTQRDIHANDEPKEVVGKNPPGPAPTAPPSEAASQGNTAPQDSSTILPPSVSRPIDISSSHEASNRIVNGGPQPPLHTPADAQADRTPPTITAAAASQDDTAPQDTSAVPPPPIAHPVHISSCHADSNPLVDGDPEQPLHTPAAAQLGGTPAKEFVNRPASKAATPTEAGNHRAGGYPSQDHASTAPERSAVDASGHSHSIAPLPATLEAGSVIHSTSGSSPTYPGSSGMAGNSTPEGGSHSHQAPRSAVIGSHQTGQSTNSDDSRRRLNELDVYAETGNQVDRSQPRQGAGSDEGFLDSGREAMTGAADQSPVSETYDLPASKPQLEIQPAAPMPSQVEVRSVQPDISSVHSSQPPVAGSQAQPTTSAPVRSFHEQNTADPQPGPQPSPVSQPVLTYGQQLYLQHLEKLKALQSNRAEAVADATAQAQPVVALPRIPRAIPQLTPTDSAIPSKVQTNTAPEPMSERTTPVTTTAASLKQGELELDGQLPITPTEPPQSSDRTPLGSREIAQVQVVDAKFTSQSEQTSHQDHTQLSQQLLSDTSSSGSVTGHPQAVTHKKRSAGALPASLTVPVTLVIPSNTAEDVSAKGKSHSPHTGLPQVKPGVSTQGSVDSSMYGMVNVSDHDVPETQPTSTPDISADRTAETSGNGVVAVTSPSILGGQLTPDAAPTVGTPPNAGAVPFLLSAEDPPQTWDSPSPTGPAGAGAGAAVAANLDSTPSFCNGSTARGGRLPPASASAAVPSHVANSRYSGGTESERVLASPSRATPTAERPLRDTAMKTMEGWSVHQATRHREDQEADTVSHDPAHVAVEAHPLEKWAEQLPGEPQLAAFGHHAVALRSLEDAQPLVQQSAGHLQSLQRSPSPGPVSPSRLQMELPRTRSKTHDGAYGQSAPQRHGTLPGLGAGDLASAGTAGAVPVRPPHPDPDSHLFLHAATGPTRLSTSWDRDHSLPPGLKHINSSAGISDPHGISLRSSSFVGHHPYDVLPSGTVPPVSLHGLPSHMVRPSERSRDAPGVVAADSRFTNTATSDYPASRMSSSKDLMRKIPSDGMHVSPACSTHASCS